MKIEFGLNCQYCDNRPACEIAGQKGVRLEKAAKNLGFTVTEGSVICQGKESRPEPWNPACGARLTTPELASEEEMQKIVSLIELDIKANRLLEETKSLIGEVTST